MLKRILLVLFVLAQGAMFHAAWGADRDAKVKELMDVLQFNDRLKERHEQVVKMLDEQTTSMMAQLRKASPNLDEQALKELNAAAQTFAQGVLSAWDPAEATRIYGSILTDGLPEKELDATIAHYRTPEGKQELKVISAASRAMNAYIMQSIQQATEVQSQAYVTQVRAIMVRQKERWSAAAAKK